MDFALEYNSNNDSGFFSFLFLKNDESTVTNDPVSPMDLKLERRLSKILRSYPYYSKNRAKLKGCWDEKYQPFIYAENTCQSDDTSQEFCYFEEHVSTMKSLLTLEEDWDSYGAESPNANSFDEAQKILDYLQVLNFPPTKLVPSVEGGISFLFIRENKYADIECDNDGDIICGLSDRLNDPVIWEVGVDKKTLFATVEKIRDFFGK